MTRDFLMPSLGADMESGRLVEWLKKPGDAVARGDLIAVVETDKGAIEIEVFDEGVLAEVLVEEGETVPVGAVLAKIEATAEAAASEAPSTAPPPGESTVAPDEPSRVRASPAARRRARDQGIDLAVIEGTGPSGSVVLEDVERHLAASAGDVAQEGSGSMRRAIAAVMTRSHREIPHYHLHQEVDFEPVTRRVARHNKDKAPSDRLTPAVFMIRAVARAAAEVPGFNGFYEDGVFRPSEAVHVGMAISLRGGGLVAPALRHAESLEPADLMSALGDLVERARRGRLRSSETAGATITLTALGERGADGVRGIIYGPQVALVGFGRPRRRPWVDGDAVVVREVVEVSLAADHRVTDGHAGSRFLTCLAGHLAAEGEA